jgi:hypothetical protein
MKHDDPVRVKLREEREQAQLWCDVLSKGLGHALSDGWRNCTEDLRPLIALVKTKLVDAVDALERAEEAYAPERAEEAYAPYWRRGRVRRIRSYPLKKKAKAKVKAA